MPTDLSSSSPLPARAVWFPGPRKAELRPESVPPPGPGEVRVKTIASALSHGTEMLVYRGEVPKETPLDLPTFAGSFGFPIKYGYAATGRVLDTGPDVRRLSAGDFVFVHHPHQSIFTVPEAMPARLPDGLDPMLGVFVANLETALNIVHDASPNLGETALVLGAGVVGMLVSQLLRLAGAGRVLVVEPLPERRRLALLRGADSALEPGAGLPERVFEETGGRGADLAVEVSGSGSVLQAAVDSVAEEGTVVVASWYGTKPVSLELGGRFHRGRVRLRSSQVGRIDPGLSPRWDRGRRTEAVMDLLGGLGISDLITHRIPFERAPEAYRIVDESPGDAMQIVLVYE
jgi:2-desacetyl-2-hydroxyethyl bacteriochlorophyllide A dehydrogenase